MEHFYVAFESVDEAAVPHVVHKDECVHLPETGFRLYVGQFNSAATALTTARAIYPDATACSVCCPECNLLQQYRSAE